MLIIFDRPINCDPDLADSRQLFERFPAEPFGELPGLQTLVMNQTRQAFDRRFLIALSASEFGLIAGLFFNDRRDEGRDGFQLMAVRPWQQLFDILPDACRLNLCCLHTNRILQVVNLCRHALLQNVS